MHTFHNFKGFKEAQIDLSKPMTLLIGRNGSGKSNVIEGVELLAELINKREVQEISDIGRGGEFEVRGSLNGCFRQGCNVFEIGFKDKVEMYNKEKVEVSYKIQVNLKSSIHYKGMFTDFHPACYAGAETYEIYQLIEKYNTVSAFDIYPRLMRQYSPIGLNQLSRNGSNISSILYYLKQNYPNILEKILKQIQQLPEEAFESFEFITTSDNSDILFALKYPNGEIISAKLLSDGTLRALAILTALETMPEHSRMVIEELDNGVHPSRVKLLVNTIWECSHRRKLNVLVTTHNPATLNSLTSEQLDCVVVCHYDPIEKADKLTALPDIPYSDVLLQKGSLGDLVTRNVLESYLMPNFEAEQQRKAQEWLDLF